MTTNPSPAPQNPSTTPSPSQAAAPILTIADLSLDQSTQAAAALKTLGRIGLPEAVVNALQERLHPIAIDGEIQEILDEAILSAHKLFTLSPTTLHFAPAFERARAEFGADYLNPNHLSLVGSFIVFSDMARTDPTLANELLGFYERNGTVDDALRTRFDNHLRAMRAEPGSAIGYLITRELDDTAVVAESAITAGIVALRQTIGTSAPTGLGKVGSWLSSTTFRVPKHLTDLATFKPLTKDDVDFLTSLKTADSKRSAVRVGVGAVHPEIRLQVQQIIDCDARGQTGAAEASLATLWRTLNQQTSFSSADLFFLARKLPTLDRVETVGGLDAVSRLANENRGMGKATDHDWQLGERDMTSLSCIWRVLLNIDPRRIGSQRAFESRLTDLDSALERYRPFFQDSYIDELRALARGQVGRILQQAAGNS